MALSCALLPKMRVEHYIGVGGGGGTEGYLVPGDERGEYVPPEPRLLNNVALSENISTL